MDKIIFTGTSLNKLSQEDLVNISRYLLFYSKEIEQYNGHFNWKDKNFENFLKIKHIKGKGNKKTTGFNYFWFDTYKDGGTNDIAFHFLRHVRNSFAHGKIYKVARNKKLYYEMQDLKKNRNHKHIQTMQGVIETEYLWEMIELIYKTKI